MSTLDYIIKKYSLDANAESPIVIPNLKRVELAKLFGELKFEAGAEIGVERGFFSEQICQGNPNVKLFCIDPWQVDSECPEYSDQNSLNAYFNRAKAVLAPYKCKFVKKHSVDGVKDFSPESLDFVYIDANHRFDYVMSDIIQWSKIVKPGGIVSGHDYVTRDLSHSFKFDVIEATNVYARAHQIKPWFVFGGDRSASWLWVKT